MILGGGPNRIGQGIEFDYCCVHAAFALRELGWETIMVNSNPETVSTDYDTSDKLYFEPLTLEDVLNIYEREHADAGHRPIRRPDSSQSCRGPRRQRLHNNRHATRPASKWRRIASISRLCSTSCGSSRHRAARPRTRMRPVAVAQRSVIRCWCDHPSCLADEPWKSFTKRKTLRRYIRTAAEASPERPILVDRFLEDATEVDVDCIADSETCVIGGRDGTHRAGWHPFRR